MKLSRLTNRQLLNLLRKGEVRFESQERIGKKFLLKFRDFCKDVIGDLKSGKYEFIDNSDGVRFVKKFDELAKKIWVSRRNDFTISEYFSGIKPTPHNIAVAISKMSNKYGPLKEMADMKIWQEDPENPQFYSIARSFQIPDSWSYFREFRH